ncbi:unnamed protein product [Paramecium sonneborni]|uniref:DUF7920 domain-containing protein n=1 Tax=Paramecium sonneborni TaxID=65129 RepID=A0A8S1Q884_9CILI|nr:unnamed protein product [Paramecium sonneborni]
MSSIDLKNQYQKNEQQLNKPQKKRQKIIDKLTQLTDQYSQQSQVISFLKQNTNQNSSKSIDQISNNQIRKHQINRLVEECQKMNENIKEIPPEYVFQMIKTYDMLFASQVKEVKLNEQNIQIIDIKLRVHDEFEDYLYSQHQLIHNTFRRGLCFLKKDDQLSILRKGLRKFFDINLKLFCNQVNSKQTNKKDEIIFNYTFSSLPKESQIKITQMEKANGENAQISYNKTLDCWIIGSKNVTLLCQNECELQLYDPSTTNDSQDQRYRFAIKIAKEWLKIIDSSEKVEQIKNQLDGLTLIGEYCGNNEYQHLVQYDKAQLKFYALVPKISDDSSVNCLHPDLTLNILQSLDLNIVKQNHYIVNNYQEFQIKLIELTKSISISKLSDIGEGNVLYFSNCQEQCFSLAKLKSLEYRFKRKIREKLKLIITRNLDPNSIIKQYVDEVTKLLNDLNQCLEEPIEIDLNINLAQKCFEATKIEEIQKNTEFKNFCIQLIDNQFIQFLNEIDNLESKENVFELAYQRNNKN